MLLSHFFRQLSVMLDAGVSITEATGVLARQSPSRMLAPCLHSLHKSVWQGSSLSQACTACPRCFSAFHVAAIAAGERSGTLVASLRHLADALEEQHALSLEIKRELFYPRLVMFLVLCLWPVVLGSLREKPGLLVLCGVLPLLTFGLLLLLGTLLPRLSGRPKPYMDRLILKIPVLGRTAHLIGQTYFARHLSFLYGAGLSLPEAVRLASDACGNTCLASRLRPAAARMERGAGLAQALSATDTLDPIILTLARTGEVTGDLAPALAKAVEHIQRITETSLHTLKLSLGLAALFNAGFCVAAIMLAAYT